MQIEAGCRDHPQQRIEPRAHRRPQHIIKPAVFMGVKFVQRHQMRVVAVLCLRFRVDRLHIAAIVSRCDAFCPGRQPEGIRQVRGFFHHPLGRMKHFLCLIIGGGSRQHLRPLFPFAGQAIKRNARGLGALGVFPRHFLIGDGEPPDIRIVLAPPSEHTGQHEDLERFQNDCRLLPHPFDVRQLLHEVAHIIGVPVGKTEPPAPALLPLQII